MSGKKPGPFNDTEAAIRLRDPASGVGVELKLTLDPEREVVVDAKYRLTDMPDEERAAELISNLIREKGFLFCMTLAGDDLIESNEGQRSIPLLLTALKLALSEYIMRRYAVETGIAKDRGEFIESFLKGHPMYEMFADIEFIQED
ncbi:MAG: hypothetical protein JW984_04170 [Deltaproteobacteria bacterium]|uniref:Uncharacterized protein n=1 Tax=Candidatus Zymogenus saltonus TaxID=2844893 RepID=A0A9D8PN22_9DELT|nr:hypothetical protein [Candidatus Zymogenus saltonus]